MQWAGLESQSWGRGRRLCAGGAATWCQQRPLRLLLLMPLQARSLAHLPAHLVDDPVQVDGGALLSVNGDDVGAGLAGVEGRERRGGAAAWVPGL